jgi:outer membrane protein assembly factor BamB
MIVLLLLLASPDAQAAKPDKGAPDVRTAPDRAAPVAAPAPVGPPPIPPEGWNAGVVEAPVWSTAPTERWGRTLGEPAVGPVVSEGQHLVVPTATEVVGLSLEGSVLWKEPLSASGGLALGPDGVWVGSPLGQLHALDPATGAVKRTEGQGAATDAVRGSLTASGKHVWWYDATGKLWTTQGWTDDGCANPMGAPAVEEALTYVACGGDGLLLALGREGLGWTTPLPGPAVTGAVLDASREYVGFGAVGQAAGGVVAVDRSGAVAWTFRSQFGPAASLSVYNGLVLLPDRDGHLYAIDAATGKARWDVEGFGDWSTRPLLTPDLIYAVNADGNLYGIDPDDGGVVWKVSLGAPAAAGPTRVGDALVVPLASGRVAMWAIPR